MIFSIAEPSPTVLEVLLREQAVQSLSYPDVRATQGGRPAGYRHARHEIELGHGQEVFERACEGLHRWQAHVWAGARVHPERAKIEEGTSIVLAVPIAFLW